MAGGVRLATGYITIEAETSKVPTQIRDALQKAGQDAAKPVGDKIGKDMGEAIGKGIDIHDLGNRVSIDIHKSIDPKATGTKIGKDISTGIREGIDRQGSGGAGQLGKKIQEDLNKGVDAKKTGEKIGKDVSDGVQEGMKQGAPGGGGAGKAIQDEIKKGADGKKTGKEIGKDVGEGVKEELDVTLDDALKPMRDWAQGVKDEIKKGDIKSALSDVGDVADNVGHAIGNLGDVVGVDLHNIEHLGSTIATTLDAVGNTVQPVIDRLRNTVPDVKAFSGAVREMGSGSTLSRIQGLSTAISSLQSGAQHLGVNMGPVGDVLTTVGQTAEGVAAAGGTVSALAEMIPALGAAAPALGPVALAALPAAALGGLFYAAYKGPGDEAEKRAFERHNNLPPGYLDQFAGQPTPRAMPAEVMPAQIPGQYAAPSMMKPGVAGMLLPPEVAPSPANLKPTMVTGPPVQNIVVPPAPAAPGAAGAAEVRANTAAVSIGSATISAGGLNLAGLNIPAPQITVAAPGGASTTGGGTSARTPLGDLLAPTRTPHVGSFFSHQEGGPITEDQLAKLHAGEHVLNAADVAALGGQDAVTGLRDNLSSGRSAGFVPAAAGQSTVPGTGAISGFMNLGNEVVGGLIDSAAQAAQMAASAAATGGTMGAGAAAGPAAQAGIQIGAQLAKRATAYGFQLAGIWGDAAVEQLSPFGTPRWLGYNYTNFVPSTALSAIGATTGEKAALAEQGNKTAGLPEQAPGAPVAPQQMPGAAQSAGPVPKLGPPAPVAGLGAAAAQPQPPQPTSPAAPEAGASASPLDLMHMIGFDDGGWLMPNQPGINTTGRPELVLSPQQLDAALGATKTGWGRGDTYHITAVDPEDVGRQIDKRKRLSMMQYSGRP